MEIEILRTVGVNVGYDKKVIINNINITIKRGQIVTLIGPNGAGKSTILKSIASQLKLLSGTIYIGGTVLSNITPRQLSKKLSIMLTKRIEPELMTCYEVIKTGRYPYTRQIEILSEHDKQQISEVMRLCSVEELADRDFSCISDGQRQRVMLARAVCQEPEILVLDEPTLFLDVHHKLKLLSVIKKLVTDKNIGVVMSMHELSLAQRISDYVVCVAENRIDKFGTPEEIFTDSYINALYNIESGSFYSKYGSVELERVIGKVAVFVIAGGGTSTEIFRKLQRRQIPFAVGIIHKNDIDFPVASALATEVISEESFEPISKVNIDSAKKLINNCRKVICLVNKFGSFNDGNRLLLEYSDQKRYLIREF